jgi:hypothetical protein
MAISKDQRRAYFRSWVKKNKQKVREYAREWARKDARENPGRRKWVAQAAARRRNGWSQDEYDEAMVQQLGMCAICGSEPATCLDHDHATGRRRGVLCGKCNVGLGHFRDNPKFLSIAIEYILFYREDGQF